VGESTEHERQIHFGEPQVVQLPPVLEQQRPSLQQFNSVRGLHASELGQACSRSTPTCMHRLWLQINSMFGAPQAAHTTASILVKYHGDIFPDDDDDGTLFDITPSWMHSSSTWRHLLSSLPAMMLAGCRLPL
jgi:hypothetical protein